MILKYEIGFFGHPEVKYVGLLTLLYSGTTSLYSFKYSWLNHIVKILNTRSKSVGNFLSYNLLINKFLHKTETSETLRDETTINTETINKISIHNSTHIKPRNDAEFGHYLAGLIDGNGHFSNKQQLVIAFNTADIKLCYYVKKRLCFGNFRKVKGKSAVLFIISNKQGIEKVINLINGKFRTISKFNQIKDNILCNCRFTDFSSVTDLFLNTSHDLENHWLAGFSDADASFQVKILNRNSKKEVRLNFQIDQKENYLLLLIKTLLGGNIGFRKNQNTYYYGSTSFGSARKVISYFDRYHMLSSKHINFLKWRKVYVLIQDKNHLNELGVAKIEKIKKGMNKLNVDVV